MTASSQPASGSAPEGQPGRPFTDRHLRPPGLTPERDRAVHNELKACECVADVLDVVADEAAAGGLSLRAAVLALTRLSALVRRGGAAGEAGEGYGALRESPAFRQLAELLHQQVAAMNQVQLVNSLQAFVQLDAPPPPAAVAAYIAAATDMPERFYPRDIAQLFSTLVALRACLSPPFPPASEDVAPSAPSPSPALLDSPRELLDKLCFRAVLLLRAGEFDSRSIASLLHGAAALGYANQVLARAAAEAAAEGGALQEMAPQGVSNSLWALARMGCYSAVVCDAALAAFQAAPRAFKRMEAANMLWACTKLRHHPEGVLATFTQMLLGAATPDRRGAPSPAPGPAPLHPPDLAALVHALANFSADPGERIADSLCSQVDALLDRQEGQQGLGPGRRALPLELCTLYWGLCQLGYGGRPVCRRLEAAIGEAEAAGRLQEGLLRMVFQGFLAWRLDVSDAGGSEAAPALPPAALDACRRAWARAMATATPETGEGPVAGSGWAGGSGRAARQVDPDRTAVARVAALLREMRVPFEAGRPSRDGLARIDIALRGHSQTGEERFVALQLIADEDCTVNTRQILAGARLQKRLLEKNGWQVRLVSVDYLRDLPPDRQAAFLRELLQDAGVLRARGAGKGAAAKGERDAAPAAGAGPAAGGVERPVRPAKRTPRGGGRSGGERPGGRGV